jgi:hypothetical protein
MVEWKNKLDQMHERKHEEEIRIRREIQKKLRSKEKKMNQLLEEHNNDKEATKNARLQQIEEKEMKIKNQIMNQFANNEEWRVEIDNLINEKGKFSLT